MATRFKDKMDEEFTIDLSIGGAFEIEEYDFCGKCPPIKLMPPDENLFEQRIGDPKLLFGIAWVLVRDQVKGREYANPAYDGKNPSIPKMVPIINELDFALRFDGKSFVALKKAVWAEFSNFFPEAATTLKNLIERLEKIQERMLARGNKLIAEKLTDEEIEKMIDKAEQAIEEEVMLRGAGHTLSG